MKTVTNPMLVGAMELLKADNTPEHRKLVMEEVMHAQFLSPVLIDPAPEPNENGLIKVAPDSKIQLPMLSSPDGKHFFMAFTDMSELQKWKKEPNQAIMTFNFKQYMGMLTAPTNTSNGVVINPFGNNMVIPKEMVEAMMGGNKPTA